MGETFIKVKKSYSYGCATEGAWYVDKKLPVIITID
jgi:hypothetical protein